MLEKWFTNDIDINKVHKAVIIIPLVILTVYLGAR